MSMEKIITYTIVDYGGGPDLIDTNLENTLAAAKGEIENNLELDEDFDIVIKIERKYTQEEINNLPEWQ